jgi:uncharacterized LabA/DUF88 family protein
VAEAVAKAPSIRVRIFVDFWNFSLCLRRQDDAFRVDWKPVAPTLLAETGKLLGMTVSFEAMHVYGSYDPGKPADVKLRNWFTNVLDRMPGTHVELFERQKKRNHPKCPHCQWEAKTCDECDGDMRGTEEKGVDTHIVKDMISLAWEGAYDVAVLVSNDRDYVPVAEFLQGKGIKVIHAAFPNMGNQLSQRCWGNIDVTKMMDQFRRVEPPKAAMKQ